MRTAPITTIASLALLVVLLTACTQVVQVTPTPNPVAEPQSLPVAQVGGQGAGADEFTADGGLPHASLNTMLQQAIPAVVRINTDTGSGSGVIIQTQGTTGYIVTNHHVVQGSAWIEATVGDSAAYEAELLGADAGRDLAVLKICCGSFQTARFGDIVGLMPATEVVVIGYPHGIPGPATITQGIVSAIRFNTTLQSQVIQTDAAMNPGNSGGPILSLGGEVLGIITFKFMDSEGLGFAIPSNVVFQELPSLWASDQPPPTAPALVPITTSSADDAMLEARIQEAIQELMPTPAPTAVPVSTPIPDPQPTQASVPAPTVAAIPTPLPPTPAPTLHPCSLAYIPPVSELEAEYTRFMATDPYTNSVNTEFRGVLARLFPEIAAAYIIKFIHDPMKYSSFRDYLGKEGYRASNTYTGTALRSLLRSDVLPRVDESLHEYNQRLASDPCTLTRTIVFADDELMTLLIVVSFESLVSPSTRQAMTRITMREIYAFRDSDPTRPLIYYILEKADSAN